MTTDITIPQNLNKVDAAIWLAKFADKAENLNRKLLWDIKENELYSGRFSSWKEFVTSTEGLGKTMGWATKMLAPYQTFVLEGGLSEKQLEGVDSERLYLATRLQDLNPEQKLNRAKTWSRDQLNEELSSGPSGDCTHEETEKVEFCKTCHKRVG